MNMEKIKELLAKDWTIGEKSLLISTCVLLGVVIGFLIAPIKSIYCGNNNGNLNNYGDDEKITEEIDLD